MKKTCVLLAGIVLIILLAFACEMPSSVELKSDKFQINAPVKVGRYNLVSILSETLKDSFPDGFELYDMIYYGNGNTQAFLIGYQMDIMESFNPSDYLKHLNDPDNMEPIDKTITIPQMITDAEMDEWFYFPMNAFFQEMNLSINYDSTPVTVMNNQAVFDFFKSVPAPTYDAVFVDECKIKITLDFGGSPLPAGITLNISGYDGSPVNIPMVPDANPYLHTVIISDAKIGVGTPLQVSIVSTPTVANMTMQVQDVTLRGAKNLRSVSHSASLPSNFINSFGLASIDDMINAQIADGDFEITAYPPASAGTSGTPTTYCEDLEMHIGYEIHMQQNPVSGPGYPPDGLAGLNGVILTEADHSLAPTPAPKWINGNALTVDGVASTISITADTTNGITFELFNDDLVRKELPIKVSMKMNIDKLEVVRWKRISDITGQSVLPTIDIPEINFANMGEEDVSFIKTITFGEIKLDIDFESPGVPQALKNHIALKVSCPELGFADDDPSNTIELENDPTVFLGGNTTLDVEASNNKVNFDAELIPIIGGVLNNSSQYIEFGPVEMDPTHDITIPISAQVKVEFDWTEAVIDLKAALEQANMGSDALDGTFPENTTDGDVVNLSPLKKYMNGVTFGGIAAKIFFAGPDVIIEHVNPQLNFDARWKVNNVPGHVQMINAQELEVADALPSLPGKNIFGEWIYPYIGLPPGDGLTLSGFNEIISTFPEDLRFHYEMTLPGANNQLTVYHNDFVNVQGDSKIKALMVVQFPLELVVAPGGGFLVPEDLFGDGEDLFGRDSPGEDSPFTGVNIKSLNFRMDFGHSLFAGSYLFFDRHNILFPYGLSLGEGGSLNITFTDAQQNAINQNLIYPDMKFVFPYGKILQISRNLLPTRIVISVSGSYTLDLEDLGL